MKKIQNKQIVIYNQKNEPNEKRFYLWTKILIKRKIRDKKKFTKKKSLGIGGNSPREGRAFFPEPSDEYRILSLRNFTNFSN